MNYPFKYKKFFLNKNFKKMLGIILAIIGGIIIIQVVPITIWLFLLGVLLVALGWLLYKTF